MNNNDQNQADNSMQPAAPMGGAADPSATVTDPNAASAPVAPADTMAGEPVMAPAMGQPEPAAQEPAATPAEPMTQPAETVVPGMETPKAEEETGGGDTTPTA